jgi:hypothetical protein
MSEQSSQQLYYLRECWPLKKLKRVEILPSRLFLVVSAEMSALLPFPLNLRYCTLVTIGL